MLVDAFASEPHYMRHLLPVWRSLPDDMRGDFMCLPRVDTYARASGVEPSEYRADLGRAVIVAGIKDFKLCRRHGKKILMEHGIGQTYVDAMNSSYAGGPHRDGVDLFLCPNAHVKTANERSNWQVPSEVVGVPAMDYWHVAESHPARQVPKKFMSFSFHWQPQSGVPEMGSAISHYARVLRSVREHYEDAVGGHAHPRIADQALRVYRPAGIPLKSLSEIYNHSFLHICDNSSVLYEFASLDRPVVVLNAPYMRRDVEHGLRFWEYADVGVQCDDPDDLIDCIDMALGDPPAIKERRREIVEWLFPYRGHATQRAVSVIRKYIEKW